MARRPSGNVSDDSVSLDILTAPRDQELRFTVHESPDYYQLKVSVFNDDKKTELIGETRVGLEEIIVPGGGQNDTWHNLYCKGRFAGEIRIELTYYDTRPKEDRAAERPSELVVEAHQEPSRDSVGGPRGPKFPKRRPLPANPTGTSRPGMPEHAHSSPLPQPAQSIIHQPIPSHPEPRQGRDPRLEPTPSSGNQYHYPQHPSSIGPLNGHDHPNQDWKIGHRNDIQEYNNYLEDDHKQDMASHVPAQIPYNRHYAQDTPMQPKHNLPRHPGHGEPRPNAYRTDTQFANYSSVEPYDYEQASPDQGLYNPYSDGYSQSPPAVPHGNSMPDVRPAVDPIVIGNNSQRHSLPDGRHYNERSPVHQHSHNSSFDSYPNPHQNIAGDDVPPPPPAHRTNSGMSHSPLDNGRSQSESCAHVPGTAPLNIRKERGSFSNSPLSQVQTNGSHADYGPSTSPPHAQHYTHSSAMTAPRPVHAPVAARDAYHRRSMSPTRNGQAMPPSLVPGYEAAPTSDVPQNVLHRESMNHGHSGNNEAIPQYQAAPSQHTQPRPHHAATIHTQSPLQALARGPDQRPHRASAPMPQPRAVSPDRRIPARKSVSPQPESAMSDRRGSGIPFGPDSYDALNPYISSGSAGMSPGARYSTPEQAKEAAYQHEREKQLGDGPIIGSDGRVIDPSDHLPTDTWAPEPEAKAPKKTAQVNIRFRNSPQGAQPMPQSSRRPLHDSSARPASASTPGYSNSPNNATENISPTSAARSRLQKRTRASPAQPSSSPIVPTVNTALQNPVLRSTASDYPLQEHENYGYGNSPTCGRPSPSGVPPPVPGKVRSEWAKKVGGEIR